MLPIARPQFLSKSFHGLRHLLPGPIKTILVRMVYESLALVDRNCEMEFMNYGWASRNGERAPVDLSTKDEPNRYCIQLYDRVVADHRLAGCDLLEIGCGRGGGAAWLARSLQPRRVTGIDLASSAVRFSRRTHRSGNLAFVRGNALTLPFEDARFDAVVNIESSHCYADMRRFLSEVGRVLRPGGHLLYADFRHSTEEVEALRIVIRDSDLRVIEEEDISTNVLHALDLDDARKRALIERRVPPLFRSMFNEFAATKGTCSTYARLADGNTTYLRYVLERTPT